MSSLSFILEMYLDQNKRQRSPLIKLVRWNQYPKGSRLQGIIFLLFSAILLFCNSHPPFMLPLVHCKTTLLLPELWLWSHFLPCVIKYLHALVLCSSSPMLMETGGSLWNSLGKWLLICHQIPLSLFFLCSLRYKKIRLSV